MRLSLPVSEFARRTALQRKYHDAAYGAVKTVNRKNFPSELFGKQRGNGRRTRAVGLGKHPNRLDRHGNPIILI